MEEAIETLRGNGPADFLELCMTLGSQMLIAGGKAADRSEALAKLQAVIADGSALDKLAEFVEAQGGDPKAVYDTGLLPKASVVHEVKSPAEGYLSHIACDEVGICSLILGGGRETKESVIDLSVGIVLRKKVGDFVKKGETLAVIHANRQEKLEEAQRRFLSACTITSEKPGIRPFIKGIIGS